MDRDFEILKLTNDDVVSVFEIEKKLIGTGSIDDIKKSLESDVINYFVLKNNGVVLGFLELSTVPPEMELFDIAIDEKFQGKGYAKLLMNFMIDFAKENKCETIFLEVNRINQKAISLYDKFGFKEYAVRKNYYGENDAILMKLEKI